MKSSPHPASFKLNDSLGDCLTDQLSDVFFCRHLLHASLPSDNLEIHNIVQAD